MDEFTDDFNVRGQSPPDVTDTTWGYQGVTVDKIIYRGWKPLKTSMAYSKDLIYEMTNFDNIWMSGNATILEMAATGTRPLLVANQ